jgi:hypothetical protein
MYKKLNVGDLCIVLDNNSKNKNSIGLITSTRLSEWGNYYCLVKGKVYNYPSASIKYIKDLL